MANDEIKFLPIFQILDIKNIWFLLELEMALATAIKKKFEPVWTSFPTQFHRTGLYEVIWCNKKLLITLMDGGGQGQVLKI